MTTKHRWFKKYVAPFLLLFGLVLLGSFMHAPKSSAAAICSFDGTWVQVNVFMRVIHPDGTSTYSTDFKFNVTASVPPGSAAAPYLDQTVAPNGGHSQNITVTGHTHACPGSPSGGNQSAYDFTDGSNGNFLLNCLGGATHNRPIDSASFTFSAISPGTATAGGSWVGATTVAFHPTTTQDLNYSNQRTVVFTYREPVPTGNLHLICNPDGTGTAWATGVAWAKYIFFGDSRGNRLTDDHSVGWRWTDIPTSITQSGNWVITFYVVPAAGGPVYVDTAVHTACPKGSGGGGGPTSACVSGTLPATFRVNQPQSNLVVAVQASSPPPTPYSNPVMNVSITSPSGVVTSYNGVMYTYNTGTHLLSSAPLPPAPQTYIPTQAGDYTFNWSIGGYLSQACSATVRGVYEPFFSVAGGDVTAGAGYCGGIAGDSAANVQGWNDGAPTYAGAGNQQAAFALGKLLGFPTGTNPDGTSSGSQLNGSGLAFANTGVYPAGQYGGAFGSMACTSNYAAAAATTATALAPGDVALSSNGGKAQVDITKLCGRGSSNFTYKGALQVMASGDLPTGCRVNLVILPNADGTPNDGYVTSNIRYASYTKVADIPRFQLLVQKGNIHIQSTVGELHGSYVAEPGSQANTGYIHTCYKAASQSDTTEYGTCNSKLVVYGAFSAGHIFFERTYGNIGGGAGVTAEPAETIQYTPELWMAPSTTNGTGVSCTPTCALDALTSLPPVL